MKINGILFDLDGTLLDTNRLFVKSLQYTLRKHLNLEIPDTEIYRFLGEPLTDTIRRFNPHDVSGMIETFRAFDLANHDKWAAFFPGVTETILNLYRKGIKLGVVTSKHRYMTSRCSHLEKIEKYMLAMITYDDVTKTKPDPEPIRKALKLLDEQEENVIMIGDSPMDIRGAKNAGTLSGAVSWSVYPKKVLMKEEPDFFIQHPTQLLNLIGCTDRQLQN